MADVEIYYQQLRTAEGLLREASSALRMNLLEIVTDDPGVGIPVGKSSLRAAFVRRVAELEETGQRDLQDSEALAARIDRIASAYTELDSVLSGESTD